MSQVIVLDTHIWIWFINQEFDLFPEHWREAIETTDIVGISPVSCYEVALAQQRQHVSPQLVKRPHLSPHPNPWESHNLCRLG